MSAIVFLRELATRRVHRRYHDESGSNVLVVPKDCPLDAAVAVQRYDELPESAEAQNLCVACFRTLTKETTDAG